MKSTAPKSGIHRRYVALLNHLVFDRPKSKECHQVEDIVHEETAECLSTGLTVFYPKAIDRVTVLAKLVKRCLTLKKNVHPLRLMLASQYFATLTKPEKLIGLAPALVELFKEENPETNENSQLLHNVFQLVFDDAKATVQRFSQDPEKFIKQEQPESEQSDSTSKLIKTLRTFLVSMQVSYFFRSKF